MTPTAAVSYLRRFQRWRRGAEGTMEDHGLDPTQIGVALDVVLSAVPTLSSSLASARSQLQKCQVQREKFHSKLRKQVPDSTPPPPHA